MKLTIQEMFNKAVTQMIKQNWYKSIIGEDTRTTCSFRGNGGFKCAIGACIEDDEIIYEEGNRKIPANELNRQTCIAFAYKHDIDTKIVFELQAAHDSSTTPLHMKHNFERFAKAYNLTFPDIWFTSQPKD